MLKLDCPGTWGSCGPFLPVWDKKGPNSQNRLIWMKIVSNGSFDSEVYEKQLNVLKVDL